MSGDFVIDTSVLAKAVFQEPGTDRVERWIGSSVQLLAPDFIRIEMMSVASKKVRLGLLNASDAENIASGAISLVDELELSSTLFTSALDLTVSSGVSFYDGLFLALAAQCSIPLVTADERLVQRVRASASPVECLTISDLPA